MYKFVCLQVDTDLQAHGYYKNNKGHIKERTVDNMEIKTNKGPKEIKIKELDFTNMMCDLEDNGVDVMALLDEDQRRSMKIFSTMRAIMGVLTGAKNLIVAGKMLSEHLSNGGTIEEIMDAFVEVMAAAGFGEASAEEETDQ